MEKPENFESPDQSVHERIEDAGNRLAAYRFARHYVGGKSVADLDPQGTGTGTRILADVAGSVASLVASPGTLERTHEANPAPNLTRLQANFPELPFSAASLDVVIGLEAAKELQRLGELVTEARRVLKDGGLLIVSAPDKRAISSREQGLYAGELRELLLEHFAEVELYRLGAVSGTVVLDEADGLSTLPAESVPFAAEKPEFGDKPPDTDLVLAVGGDGGLPASGVPYLLLDRDRRLLDEREDAREEVELLKAEIRQMQETEVQAFQEIPDRYVHEIAHLRARAAEAVRLRQRLDEIEGSRTYRVLGIYRRLRIRLNDLIRRRGR